MALLAPSAVPAAPLHHHHRCDGLKGRQHWGCRTRWHPAPRVGVWAIPAVIVKCESGFKNERPNSAGAAGYYQITEWHQKGGHGAPYANEHSRAEQDAMARHLWEAEGTRPWTSSAGCWGGRV